MAKYLVYFGIAVLAVIAVFLGYKIYQQQMGVATTPTIQQSQTKTVPQESTKQVESPKTSSQPKPPSAEELNLVKSVPNQKNTLAERVEFNKKIAAVEKSTDIVEITNCTPYPIIARVKENSTLKLQNNDTVDHLIFVGQDQVTVKAKGNATASVGKGDGITNLTCNGGTAGLMHIAQ